ncbi:MAG: carboxypeptidase regulatory-like domain-containing protein [Bryobacteraceae bacterium]
MISGTVVDGESGDAIRKAVVTLSLPGTPRRWATTRTDGSGRFQFDGLPAGKYDLRATKASEGTAIYGANHRRELGDTITLGDGETRGNITLRFLHSASISGHVYDSDGEPVADVTVNLLRQGRNLGAPILTNYRTASTDDRGEYRISSIDPGQYYLHTTPPRLGRFGGPGTGGEATLVDQYYGGARDSKDSTPIHVGGGETLAGLDFRLVSEPAVELRGQILGVPAESAPESPQAESEHSGGLIMFHGGMGGPAIRVTITPAEAGSLNGQGRWTQSVGAQDPEHHFQMPALPAGRYRIEAVLEAGNKTYGASQVLDLHANSGEIALTLAPAVDLAGTLRVEGQAPPVEAGVARLNGVAATRQGGLRVQLARPGSGRNSVTANVGADGKFSLPQIVSGDWQLSVTPVPPGFLKSARLGDKDVRFSTFEIGSNTEAPLNIVVSMNTATVEGEIDSEGDSKRAGVVIAPVGPYHNLARYYYGTTANDKGKFHISGIAPGKYKIFAVEKMAPASFRTPEAADQLDELGEAIELAEGATLEAHPKLIPVDRAAQALQ